MVFFKIYFFNSYILYFQILITSKGSIFQWSKNILQLKHDMDDEKTMKIDKFMIDESLNDVHDIGTLVDVIEDDSEKSDESGTEEVVHFLLC